MKPTGRKLSCIPILHAGADMGQLAAALENAAASTLEPQAWQRRLAEVAALWDAIEQAVFQLELDLGHTLVYQDGLPVCGREADIVDELAAAGSRNYRLLQRLAGQGAQLMGTEAPELLIEEHELARQRLNAPADETQRHWAARLLEQRDRFIADRIAATLPQGGHGLLFIGALHDVARALPPDIEVLYPLGRPRREARS